MHDGPDALSRIGEAVDTQIAAHGTHHKQLVHQFKEADVGPAVSALVLREEALLEVIEVDLEQRGEGLLGVPE